MKKEECKEKKFIDIVSEYKNRDCNFIRQTKCFKEILLDIEKILGINCFFNVKKLFKGIYVIDKYILKFSTCYIPFEIEYTDEMVKTYYRKNFEFKCDEGCLFLGIVIQDYISNNYICNEDELYSVYYSLRKKGYIWMDAKITNIKKLNDKILIVDIDYIYKEQEANFSNQSILSKICELKYNLGEIPKENKKVGNYE